jgi:hypothetical protein
MIKPTYTLNPKIPAGQFTAAEFRLLNKLTVAHASNALATLKRKGLVIYLEKRRIKGSMAFDYIYQNNCNA